MRLSKKHLAAHIDRLAELKATMAPLHAEHDLLVAGLKKAGGGESATWRADLVKMPARTMVIPKHKQLRLYAKH